ncbi:acyl-coenzyme A thioesterase 13-like [Chenopodium quinoa]|uniref:acyl-coenzyme A thioesterase 13-like n=1 Tax=Chenopodium quinoa TaxID=63459 RepID=UPI000B793F52|nr:acyl-coenzyme A thioesterase 13-like [Chenopodium quinoa]
MEKAKGTIEASKEESEIVSKLDVHPHRPHLDFSFYEDFTLRGISVDRVEPQLVVCSFKVPPRLTDRNGNLASGAIANLVDELGAVVIYREGLPMNVSVTMSISYVSTANVDDELEVTSRLLGRKGFVFGTTVVLKNKATGETIAEGRHTLFSKHASKI